MELKLKKLDIEQLIKKEFGEETAIEEITKDFIIINISMLDFSKHIKEENKDKEEEKRKEKQELTPEQEKAIRLEVLKQGGGRSYDKASSMDKERTVEDYENEPQRKRNVYKETKYGTIIDGVK